MEYELKDYCRVKYALVCARQSFLKIMLLNSASFLSTRLLCFYPSLRLDLFAILWYNLINPHKTRGIYEPL